MRRLAATRSKRATQKAPYRSVSRSRRDSGTQMSAPSRQAVHNELPATDVVAVVLGRKLGDPQPLVVVGEVRLGARTTQRGPGCDQHGQPAFVLRQALDAGLLDAPADVGQLLQIRDRRRRPGAVVKEGTERPSAQPQRPDARQVVHAEQEVDLLQRPHLATFPLCRGGFAPLHQHTAPAIRRRVHKDAEGRRPWAADAARRATSPVWGPV